MKKREKKPDRDEIVLYICQELKQRILDGKYDSGKKLNQTTIAKEFGVSRTPVTRALSILETEGHLINIPQKGYFLPALTVKNLMEMYQIRQMLHVIIAPDIIKYITPEEIRELRGFFAPFINRPAIDVEEYLIADQNFHNRLFEISRHQLVNRIQKTIPFGYRQYRPIIAIKPEETLQLHLDIIDAIEAKNVKLTAKLLHNHTGANLEKLRQLTEYLVAMNRDPDQVLIDEFRQI